MPLYHCDACGWGYATVVFDIMGDDFAAMDGVLVDEQVVQAIAEVFTARRGDKPLR